MIIGLIGWIKQVFCLSKVNRPLNRGCKHEKNSLRDNNNTMFGSVNPDYHQSGATTGYCGAGGAEFGV